MPASSRRLSLVHWTSSRPSCKHRAGLHGRCDLDGMGLLGIQMAESGAVLHGRHGSAPCTCWPSSREYLWLKYKAAARALQVRTYRSFFLEGQNLGHPFGHGLTRLCCATFSTSSGTMRRIWTEDGIRGFYRGLGPTIFGYLPTWAIYFTVYDQCKASLANTLSKCTAVVGKSVYVAPLIALGIVPQIQPVKRTFSTTFSVP